MRRWRKGEKSEGEVLKESEEKGGRLGVGEKERSAKER